MERFPKSDGKIHLHSLSIKEELLRYEEKLPKDAFMILSPGQLINRYQTWTKNLPRVKPFYATKCNDDHLILKTLAALGVGFDCASEHELKEVIKLGVPPEDIIFANPTKQESHITVSAELGVSKMTFDNYEEINKVKAIYPYAELVVRLRYDAKKTLKNLSAKFGAGFGDAVALLVAAKRLDMSVMGLSFHLGSDIKDVEVFGHVIKSASIFFQVAKEIGHNFTLLDIGGGFPGTLDDGTGPSMQEFGKIIGDTIDKYFPEESGVTIIAEPGRYFATPTCTLVTRIHSIRKLEDENFMYYINDGTYGCLNCVYRGNAVLIPTCLKDNKHEELFACSLWGPTCDSSDKLFWNILFPKLEIGDRIIFWNAGAYTLSAGGTFNGFPMPKVIYCADLLEWAELKELLDPDDFEQREDHVDLIEEKVGAHKFVSKLLGGVPLPLYAIT